MKGKYYKLNFKTTQRTPKSVRKHEEQEIKCRWSGDVIRLHYNRWTDGVWSRSRRTGRSATRWADGVKKQAGNLWNRDH